MPTLKLKTVSANQVWASPDGQRKIFEIEADYEGKPVKAKTYSNAIATVGWEGEVELYEKQGRKGLETFVKQPPKEGGYGSQSGKPRAANYQADPFTMYLSYAKDIAVALVAVKGYTAERLAEIVSDVALAGEQLYDARPDNKAKSEPASTDKPISHNEPESLNVVAKKGEKPLPGQLTIEDVQGVFDDDMEPVDG